MGTESHTDHQTPLNTIRAQKVLTQHVRWFIYLKAIEDTNAEIKIVESNLL